MTPIAMVLIYKLGLGKQMGLSSNFIHALVELICLALLESYLASFNTSELHKIDQKVV